MNPVTNPAGRIRLCGYVASATLLMLGAAASTALSQPSGSPGDESGPSVESLLADVLHYTRIGRFDLANAQAGELLAHPDLDPAGLVAIADQDARSLETLLLALRTAELADSAARILEVLRRGEVELRRDPQRILTNIQKLAGPPQMEHNATEYLIESGEYAVPWMLHALADPSQAELQSRVLAALPQIGREAVNPLVAALAMDEQSLRGHVVRMLGQMGYMPAVPYLMKVLLDPATNASERSAAQAALQAIEHQAGRPLPASAAEAFVQLAQQYYDEWGSVAADPRLETANVWYWNTTTQFVEPTAVPQRIFGQVMAMRCCEEALRVDPANEQAIALWLAADIRREAHLGMDVESAEPAAGDEPDNTRPDEFPRALYFTRAAGARYAHLVLARAIEDRDAPVALGAIAALSEVAGAASLVGPEDYKLALVRALDFPDRVVRVRAALALGNALPRSGFSGSARVVPVLARALTETTNDQFVVVDPDADNRNRVAADLRRGPTVVIAEADFAKAMDRARRELDNVSAFVFATDIAAPAIMSAVESLQREFVFARTPVVLLVKPGGEETADRLAAAYDVVGRVGADADGGQLTALLTDLRSVTGEAALDEMVAAGMALQAADTLYRIATDGRTVFDYAAAEAALISALASGGPELQTRCLSVLALVGTAGAQRSVADVTLNEATPEPLRLHAFEALSTSAKAFGNHLDDQRITRLLGLARDEANMTIRAAASQALGSRDLADNNASDIIRSYYRGTRQ